jgi:hypothetical protein
MPIDTDRLVHIAAELKTLDQRREKLLDELQRIAGSIGGGAPAVRRGPGRPLGSRNQASGQGTAAVVSRGPGRPPRSLAPAVAVPAATGRKPGKSLTTDIVEFIKNGDGAYTAGEVIAGLHLPATKRQNWSVSNSLVRLVKEGRLKKDKVRGYRAA